MPASMISAPTGGRPNVMGSSIATVAMVPMPGSTPTSVPTKAPIRHSRRLIGVKATPKPRARLEKSSAITPSLNQETREKLQRQPQRIRKEQTAADRQANADNDGFLPFRFRRAQRGDHEAGESRDHQAQRPDRDRKGDNGQRYEQWASPGIDRQCRAVGQKPHHGHDGTQRQQQHPEHAGRGAATDHTSSKSCGANASTTTAMAAEEFRMVDAVDLPGEWPIVSAMHVSSAADYLGPNFLSAGMVTPPPSIA